MAIRQRTSIARATGSSIARAGGFGGRLDLSNSDTLLQLARMEGGALQAAAEELMDPRTSILATMGEKFKNGFKSFVEVISVPGQTVAGILSPDISVREAIEGNISPSDVIFGEKERDLSGLQKVGSFLVRTAVDILLDPITYVGFGAVQGIFGIRSATKVFLGEKAAEAAGKKALSAAAINKEGKELFVYLKKLERQAKGTIKGDMLKGAPEALKLTAGELDTLLKESLDSPLGREFAEKALSHLFEKFPHLTKTLLDKGGIKFMGASILSGQRILATKQMIPGMTTIDRVTEPIRNRLLAPFSTSIQKNKFLGQYERLPEEFIDSTQRARDYLGALDLGSSERINNIVKANKLQKNEGEILTNAMEWKLSPANPKLAKSYREVIASKELKNAKGQFEKFTADDLEFMNKNGIPVSTVSHYVTHLVRQKTIKTPFKHPVSTKVGAQFEANLAKFIDNQTGKEMIGKAGILGLRPKITQEEINKIIQRTEQSIEKSGTKIASFKKEILSLTAQSDQFFKGKVTGEFEALLKTASVKDKENIIQFLNVIRNATQELQIGKITAARAAQTLKEGVRIKEDVAETIKGASEEALEALKKRLKKGEEALPFDIETVNTALREAKDVAKKSGKSTTETSKEVLELMRKLKGISAAKRFTRIGKDIDNEQLASFIKDIKIQFEKNPQGIRRFLDSIIGKEQKIATLLSDIQLEKTIAKTEISELPETGRFFVDKENRIFTKHRAAIQELRDAGFEFEPNVAVALLQRSFDNNRAVVSRYFMQDLVTSGYAKPASKAGPGWVPISSKAVKDATKSVKAIADETDTMSPLKVDDIISSYLSKDGEGLVFHPAVASRLEQFFGNVINDDTINDTLRAYDSLQAAWKSSVTSIWPAFHGRNAISNVFLSAMDIGLHVFNPQTQAMSMNISYNARRLSRLRLHSMSPDKEIAERAMADLAELSSKEMFTDAAGYKWTMGEMFDVMRNNNVAFTKRITSNVDVVGGQKEEFINSIYGARDARNVLRKTNPLSKNFKLYEVGRGFGTAVEEHSRIIHFITNLRKTGDVNLAAKRTKQFLFDYSNLTDFEKTFLRRLIPFYTFTRKNLELQVKTLMRDPGRIAAEVTALRNLSGVLSGEELTEQERDALPDWIKSGIEILKSKRGSTVEILGSLGTPIEQPFQAFQPNQFLGSISPLLRIPVEQMSGYSFFHGKALSDVTNAAAFKNAPRVLKDFIGYTESTGTRADGSEFSWSVSMRPERMHLILNLPPTSRVYTALKQMTAQDVSTQSKILQQLVGLRPFSFDLEQEAAKRERELREKLEKLLISAGVVAKFSRTFIPKD